MCTPASYLLGVSLKKKMLFWSNSLLDPTLIGLELLINNELN